MKRLLTALIFLTTITATAQDTIWVQTFTYDTISTRRAIFDFPSSLDGKQFEKVLMYYNIKCDPLTPWDGYDCGEWDYLAYSQIWDHTGNLDSNIVEGPQFLVNNEYVDPVEYVISPYYHYYDNYQKFITYTSELDNDYAIGAGATSLSYPFGAGATNQRTQLLYTAAELSGAGVTAGDIDKIRFDVGTLGGSMGNLTIKMKHASASDIFTFDESGWTNVYQINTSFVGTGVNTFNLTYPFSYDGTSDVIIEITYENMTPSTDNIINGDVTANTSVVTTSERLGHLNVGSDNHAIVELSDYDFGDDITISFWARGDAGYLPVNTSSLEAQDSLGNRVINIHHPWSNERVYWDSGEGSPYDRIDKLATAAEYEGNWHHWAFTKNASTGEMNIYLDGALWHTGSGLTRPVGIVNKFILGANRNGGNDWAGQIDEFRIWDAELSAGDIAAWMDQKITAAHPNYADLVLYYDFDNDAAIVDKSVNGRDGMMTEPGMVVFGESMAGHTATNERPNITFVQGTYTSSLDSTLVVDSVMVDPVDVLEYQVDGRKFTIADIEHHYPVGYSYEYDHLGAKTDSTFHGADASFANDSIFYYQEPFEVIDRYEIGRFITPYGIGFTLGPNGFTYIYDVTDYQSLLLKDSVDFGAHNTQELIDVKFAFIVGTPPRDVVKMEKLWNGRASYSYSSLDNDVNLSATDVALDPAASMYKIKTRMTGHGHHGSVNCCEWGQGRYHEISLDGTPRFTWDIWQETECGDNPNIGQGGTWPYAREGWCPGDLVKENEFEITDYVTPGSTVSVDYDITDVPAADPDQGNGNYVVTMHMISYGAPNFTNDASIVDVLNPNDWEYYGKWNPTCQNPRVILKNTGSEPLTSCDIYVWIGGFDNWAKLEWTGNLGFLEEELVEVPVTPEWWYEYSGTQKFSAMTHMPNGTDDEYAQNDKFTTYFDIPKAINTDFYIWLKTNNKPEENEIWLLNDQGDTVYSRYTLAADTQYKDTMYSLPTGCYTLEIYDSDHDGIGFWASSTYEGETSGFLRLREVDGGMIEAFTTDWGHYLSYSFSVGYGVGFEDDDFNYDFDVYPNPTEGILNVNLNNFTGDRIELNVYNELGQRVFTDLITDNNPEGYIQREIDLSGLPDGVYLINVTSDDLTASKKIILK